MENLKVRLPLAVCSGMLVFLVLVFTAWYGFRGIGNVCRRQFRTRAEVHYAAKRVEEFRKEHERLPERLSDIRELRGRNGNEPSFKPRDEWERPIQYRPQNDSYAVFSYGRDGKDGGIGLDADIYHDGRNRERTLPTFRQFFFTNDSREVDVDGFINAGVIAGVIVAIMILGPLRNRAEDGAPRTAFQYCLSALGVVVLASAIGLVLLPLHIPSGH